MKSKLFLIVLLLAAITTIGISQKKQTSTLPEGFVIDGQAEPAKTKAEEGFSRGEPNGLVDVGVPDGLVAEGVISDFTPERVGKPSGNTQNLKYITATVVLILAVSLFFSFVLLKGRDLGILHFVPKNFGLGLGMKSMLIWRGPTMKSMLIWLGIAAIVAMGIYAPWKMTFTVSQSGGSVKTVKPLGYGPLWHPPPAQPGEKELTYWGRSIDFGRLGLQWGLVIVIIAGGIYTLRKPKVR